MQTAVIRSIGEIAARDWNALLAADASPFLRHEFLLALETSGSATPETGWDARHLLLRDAGGRLAGALPLYLKPHSWGEFVFDFAWADAYRQAGLRYYPKLVSAVPFTPVTGPRLLAHPEADAGAVRAGLLAAARELVRDTGASSLHLLFPAAPDRAAPGAEALLPRLDCQFHWRDAGYGDFEGFLGALTAKKRKKLRRERRRVAEAGIAFETFLGGELDDAQVREMHALHAGTFVRHGHPPYLTVEFFRQVARSLPEALVVEFARRQGELLACTIFFRGAGALYGRYWGAAADQHSLHFEACYYRGIDYCLREGLGRFEPGTQGEHKLLRGFAPTLVHSLHHLEDPRFARAIGDWLERERRQVLAYAGAVAAHLPFRRETLAARLDPDVRDHLAAAD